MADELTTKRIINLPAESAPAAGDVLVVDNETTGTKKLPITGLIDPTPTQGSSKAVSSGGVYEQVEGINDKFESISSIGKNLYNIKADNAVNGYFAGPSATAGSPVTIASNANSCIIWVPITGGNTYTVQKTIGHRFQIAESESLPAVGTSLTMLASNAEKASLTVTTSASANYLAIIIWNGSYDTSITLAEMKASVQVEEGSTATSYEPYGYTAKDDVARAKIESIEELDALDGVFPYVQTTAVPMAAIIGSALELDISTMTGSGNASYADDKWTIALGGKVSGTVNVTAGKTYRIEFDITYNYGVDGDINTNPAIITLDDQSISVFSANDANWEVALTTTNSGAVEISIEFNENWNGTLNNITIKPVNALAGIPLKVNNIPVHANASNLAFGGHENLLFGTNSGKLNTAFGINAQKKINTGLWNSAVGYASQLNLTQGKGNTAFGYSAQYLLTTGCYNNAFGESSQNHMTDGQWNDGFGIETQGMATSAKNNVAMGRRSQHLLETGNFNTSIGAWSGFNSHDVSPEGTNAVRTSSYTTLVGGASTLISADTGDSDYATAIGYQTKVGKQGVAIGALAEADEGGIAIGYNAKAGANEVVIGNKKIIFNADNTVTWEEITLN